MRCIDDIQRGALINGTSRRRPLQGILFYNGRPMVVHTNYCEIRRRERKMVLSLFLKKRVCLTHGNSLKRIHSKDPVFKICTQGRVFRKINFLNSKLLGILEARLRSYQARFERRAWQAERCIFLIRPKAFRPRVGSKLVHLLARF